MQRRSRLLFAAALILSAALHFTVLSHAPIFAVPIAETVAERVSLRHAVTQWVVPTPAPTPTPFALPKEIDPSKLGRMRLTPADEQIVVFSATQAKSGKPSVGPHIMRVEIRPGVVRSGSTMHLRILTSLKAEGVYMRFIIWEVGVPPLRAGTLPLSDRDYPGQPYFLFKRRYTVPWIPPIYRGRTYQVEVIAVGRHGIAAGAFIPIRVE